MFGVRSSSMGLTRFAPICRLALEEGGKPAEALEAYLKGEALDGQSPEACNELRRVYEQNGLHGFARARAERRIGDLRNERNRPAFRRRPWRRRISGIGDLEQALSWLEEAYRQRCPTMALLKTDRRWALAGASRVLRLC